MSDTKYYTPSIEEFHEGFEYEYKLIRKDEWIKATFDIDSGSIDEGAGDYHDYAPNNPNAVFRVKQLDSDDIVSLGWNFLANLYPDVGHLYGSADGKLELVHGKREGYPEKVLSIYESGYPDPQKKKLFFFGVIRNRSELLKLIKRLGI